MLGGFELLVWATFLPLIIVIFMRAHKDDDERAPPSGDGGGNEEQGKPTQTDTPPRLDSL